MKKEREVEESSEDLQNVKNDAPAAKFQQKQQVAPSTGFNSDTGSAKFTLEKKKAPGSQLKQEIASTTVRDNNLVGGASGDGASFAGLRSSGSVGGVAGAMNATPNVGKPDRSGSRTGKKLDRNSTKLNFIPSDQTLTEWDESKPLADAADADQGFNGTYRNEFARSQKKVENVPGALMFDRSVDLITKDKLYFGQGQIVRQAGATADEAVTKNATLNAYGIYENATSPNYTAGAYGNYFLKKVKYQFNPSGHLDFLLFEEEDATPTVDEHEANKSSVALKIAVNRNELWREAMDTKAGDEKADIWTPLARAVEQPTATIGLLESIEADVGNEIVTAYRKACTSFSFQLNRAHKDGQWDVEPGVLFAAGVQHNYVSKAAADAELPATMQGLWPNSANNYDNSYILDGSASTMIALYDSPAKYNTKADLLVQPRGFRMHLQTADNNMDPFYADKLFVAAYDASETFSTIEREYDPMAPVFMTDKASVAHRISLHKMGSFVKNKFSVKVSYDKDATAKTVKLVPDEVVSFIKAKGLNAYLVYKKEASGSMSVDDGVFKASATYEFANGNPVLYFAAATPTYDSDTEAVLTIQSANIVSLQLNFKGTMKCNSDSDAEKEFVTGGGVFTYLYSDLRNSYHVDVKHPLIEGLCDYLENAVGAKYYSLSKGRMITVNAVHSTQYITLWDLLLCAAVPFIVKVRINSFRDLLYYEKNVEYPFKDALVNLGEVKTKAYSNFGFLNYDTELEVKRMLPATAITWIMPEMLQQVGYDSVNAEMKVLMPWYTSQVELTTSGWDDDASAMSFPSIRSGVRFAMLDSLYGMSEKDVRLCLDKVASFKNLFPTASRSCAYKYSAVADGQLVLAIPATGITGLQWISLPRELGYVMDAPYGVLTPDYLGDDRWAQDIVGTTGYRATYWLAENALGHTTGSGSQSILNNTAININRAANFKQVWFVVLASGTLPPVDHGFVLSLNQILSDSGALLVGDSKFKPFAALDDTGAVTTNLLHMLSFQKAMWTRLQKLPFVISPFDLKVLDNTGSPNNGCVADPYDLMYAFGLGGFRASDFRESVYNREKEIVNQGYLFTADPWILASPLMNAGSFSSGVSVSKGFEL